MSKHCITLSLDDDLIGRLDELAATMGATRSWTAGRLLDSAIPAGKLSPGSGDAGDPSPGIGPEAAGREAS